MLLSNDEIAIVNNLIWEKPVREVAAKIGRSLMALHYYLKHRDNYPPKCPSPKEKEFKQLSPISPASAAVRFPNTIATAGAATTTITRSAPTKKPKLEPIMSHFQQEERLVFANMYKTWSESHWRRVVFHDERKFNLDGPDGFTHYYHDLRNYERTLSQRPRGGSVYIWFAISYGGAIRCEVSTTKFKPESYVELIQKDRAKITEQLGGNPDFWLQDHCNSFQNFSSLQSQSGAMDLTGIKAQQWPSLSHDVNICENVWGWLIREVYDSGRRYSRKDDLRLGVQMAWSQLPTHFIQNLYSTLPERMMELYYTNGIYTNC